MNNDFNDIEDVIDLKSIFFVIWDSKMIISTITLAFTIFSLFISLSLQNVYLSQSLLVPTSKEDSLSSKLSSFTSLPSFAGVQLQGGTITKSQEGIERIKSYDFFINYFLPKIELKNIYAVKKWVPEENILIYNDNLYNDETKEWMQSPPSNQTVYKIFKEILTVNQDKKTSLTTISIEHHSPKIAKKWVDIIINAINNSMRQIDADQAEKSIRYLNDAAQSTSIQPIKEAIAKLLENQMQVLMLTASNEDYVFKVIDPPIAPEKKFKPSRTLICIFGAIFGMLFSLIVTFVRHFYLINK